jgi:antitoxin (DNA-binding transcriptional repressor) of toxin-antitoxin stability system
VKKVTLEIVQARLGEYVARSAKQPLLIIRDGEPVAMLIGLSRKKPKSRVKLREVLKGAWKDYDRHGAIPHDEFWQTLEDEVNKS